MRGSRIDIEEDSSVISMLNNNIQYFMNLRLPAIFNNKREKIKWTVTPIIGMGLIILCCFVPIAFLVQRSIRLLITIFFIAIIFLAILGVICYVSIPTYIILNRNYIYLNRPIKKEVYSLAFIRGIDRGSSGVLILKMIDGREIVRTGIDDRIIYYLRGFLAHYYPNIRY